MCRPSVIVNAANLVRARSAVRAAYLLLLKLFALVLDVLLGERPVHLAAFPHGALQLLFKALHVQVNGLSLHPFGLFPFRLLDVLDEHPLQLVDLRVLQQLGSLHLEEPRHDPLEAVAQQAPLQLGLVRLQVLVQSDGPRRGGGGGERGRGRAARA